MLIENCLFAKNTSLQNGGAIWSADQGQLENKLSITNSTFAVNNGGSTGVFALGGDDSNRPSIGVVQNSIFANNATDIALLDSDALIQSNGGNLSSIDNTPFFDHITDLQITDPLFVDATIGDYRLSDISPAVNSGITPAPSTDIDGNPRVGAPDRGAFENQNVANFRKSYAKTKIDIAEISIAPNPVSNWLQLSIPDLEEDSYNVDFLNELGQIVRTHLVESNGQTIRMEVKSLIPGIYFIHLSGKDKSLVASAKFVKE
jgi:predicted outer membrane repeat protein